MPRNINYPGYQAGGSIDSKYEEMLELEEQLFGGGRRQTLDPGMERTALNRWRELRDELGHIIKDPEGGSYPRSGLLGSVDPDRIKPGQSFHVGHSGRGSTRSRLPNLWKPPGRGLRGLFLAGGATALNPMSALADVLMSPSRLGSGDLPEEDLLSDEEKMRYYDELMGQGAGLMPRRDYFSRPSSEDAMTRGYPGRQPRRASGGIIGLQQGGPAPQVSAVTSYGVPQQTATQWAGLTDRIVAEGQRRYQQYGGQRIAGFTQPEAAAMAGQVAYGQGMGPMGTRQAAQTLGQAGQMIGGAQQGLMGLQPQYAQMAGQFGAAAPLAQQQAQQAALGMGQLAGRAQLQGQLAGAGMRQTGAAGQIQQQLLGIGQAAAGATEQARQQFLGAGQAAAGQAAQARQQQFGAGQATAGLAGQQQMAGLGAGMGAAGQAALAAQQQFGAGMQGFGAGAAGQAAAREAQAATFGQQAALAGQAGQAQMAGLGTQAQQLGAQAMGQMGATGQQALGIGQQAMAQMGGLGGQAGQLGTDIRGQLGGTGLQAQQAGQVGAADIRAAGLEGQQAALAGQRAITGVGGRAGVAGAQTAADIQAAGAGAQQLGQQALAGITGVGGQSQQQAQQAAERMRQIGGQAPELQRGADLSQYMSQYTAGVTDPQLQQLMEFQRMQGQELKSTAAQQGAYGGSRMGVQAAEQAKAASQQAADIIGKGQQEAFPYQGMPNPHLPLTPTQTVLPHQASCP